jgi:hypothetical protein
MNRPPFEVADIIRAAGKSFIEKHRSWLTRQHLKVLSAIERCRTAALGGHRDRCSRCGHTVAISYNCYLIDKGADLRAHDLGKKNDGNFGSSVEPLMPIDYAIGVGTFVPNNAVIMHEDVVKLMSDEMKKRGITHTTSECTLRGFTCSIRTGSFPRRSESRSSRT